MVVTVTRRYKENYRENLSSYSYSRDASLTTVKNDTTTGESTTVLTAANPIPMEINFVNTETPSVEDYNTDYFPTYGKNPIFKCIVFDEDDNELEQLQVPKRFCTNGVLMRIEYDLAGVSPSSGKIIIYKG